MPMNRKASFWQCAQWLLEAAVWHIVLGIFRLMPIEMASSCGGWLARKIGPLTRANRTALINVKLVFPNYTAQQTEKFGGEFPHLTKLRPYDADGRVEIIGHEHLQKIIDSGQPAVLVSGHFANWEVMAAAVCLSGLPARVSYRHTNNPWIDRSITKTRLAYGIPELSAKGGAGAKEMLEAMKKGHSVTFLNDQKFNLGIEADFFGHKLMTAPGPSRLALRFDAPIIPVSIERLPKARFKVRFHAPMYASKNENKTKAIAETVEQINIFLEKEIRKHPQNWFWVHRRWPKHFYKKQ